MKLHLKMGSDYNFDPEHGDGSPDPLVLIGSQIFGLKETPFTKHECGKDIADPHACDYEFRAPVVASRNAQAFIVSDLRWWKMKTTGTIDFYPMFTGLTLLSTDAIKSASKAETTKDKDGKPIPPPKPSVKTIPTYAVAGLNLRNLQLDVWKPGDPALVCAIEKPCLSLYVGNHKLVSNTEFSLLFQTETTAILKLNLSDAITAKSIRFLLRAAQNEDDASVAWDLAIPKAETPSISVSPAFVHVADSRKVTFSGDQVVDRRGKEDARSLRLIERHEA
jgi:hypothetical protein